MADETLLKDLMQLDLSEYTTEPYNITTNPDTDKQVLLSDYIRGTTIGDEWKTPAQDTLTNDKPGFLGKTLWSFGTTVVDTVRNMPAGITIAGVSNPISTVAGVIGASKGAAAGTALVGKALTKTAGLPKYISAPVNFTGKLGGAVVGGAAGVATAGAALLTAKEAFDIEPAGESDEMIPAKMVSEAQELYTKNKITEEQYNKRIEEAYAIQQGQDRLFKNEAVDLLKGRDYPDADVAGSVLSWASDWIQDRQLLRAAQMEQRGQNPNDFSYQAGSVFGSLTPIIAANYLYRSALLRPRYETLHPGSRFRETVVEKANPFTRQQISDKLQNFGKAFVGTQELANYTAETVSDYIERTGDKDLVYYQPSDIQGLMAGGYAAISAITEYELGGLEDIITGSFKKVGIKTPLAYAYGKAALQEGGEEFVQQLEEFLARKIDGTTDKTWGEALKEALVAGVWGAAIGGFVGGTAFKINRANLVKGIMKFGEEKGIKIDVPTATKIADTMMETVEGSLDPKKKDLWNNLRGKISFMMETSDIANKEDRIDAITDLEYALIAADAGFDGIDIENHPLFQGEVNKLGWFRAGIPEESRAVINDLLNELNDLETQLKTLNEAKDKDWEKIDEIERKLEMFDRYVLDKLGENAPASLKELDNELRKVENKYVNKEKKKAGIPTDWFSENITKGNTFTTEEGTFTEYQLKGDKRNMATFTVFESPDGWIVRNAYVPESMQKKGVATNFYTEMNKKSLDKTGKPLRSTQPRILKSGETVFELSDAGKKLWESLERKGIARKLEDNTYTFVEAQPLFQPEQFDLADENARLDDIYPAYDGETIEVDGKERTVYNSNGDRIAKSKEALTNFWRWFGDSKVVDEQGRPLVVYHGTKAQFSEFLGEKIGQSGTSEGVGFYFTNDKNIAAGYGDVMSVYLKLEKPVYAYAQVFMAEDYDGDLDTMEANAEMIRDASMQVLEDLKAKGYEFYDETTSQMADIYTETDYDSLVNTIEMYIKDGIKAEEYDENKLYNDIREAIIKEFGFDGFKTKRYNNSDAAVYVALMSNQIKSVDNRGTYSSDTGNIYYQSDTNDKNLVVTHGIGLESDGIYSIKQEQPILFQSDVKKYKVRENRPEVDKWFAQQDRIMAIAKEHFGTTTNIAEAGYILPDGTLLDLSGVVYGGMRGKRKLDHRDITGAFDENPDFPDGVSMEDFINAGAIRFSPESYSFMMAHNPTSEQLKQIDNILQDNAETPSSFKKNINIELMSDANEWMNRAESFYQEWNKTDPDIKEIKRLTNSFYVGNGVSPITIIQQKNTKGARRFGAYIPQYRFIVRTNKMDASTLSHELAHDWFEINFNKFRSGKASPEFMRAWGALEKALGITDKSTKAEKNKTSEAFARAYEGWIMNNKGWEKLINVDDKDRDDIIKMMLDYQSDLRDIYQDLTNPYFKQTWGKLGEMKPEIKAWFDKVVNITDIDKLVERGEMTPEQATQEKLNQAIDTVIENTENAETKKTLETIRVLNDTKRYEAEGGNKNALQVRLANLAQAIDENNMLIKENYDTHRDMLEVAKQADNFVKTRLEDALAIINGQMAEQEGLFKEDIYTALERLALENGDLNLLDELKNSEVANRLAKELGQRVAGFRNWNAGDMDIVSSLKALDNKFNKALKNKKAQAQMAEAEQMFAKAQEQQDKMADKQLDSFLKDIECK